MCWLFDLCLVNIHFDTYGSVSLAHYHIAGLQQCDTLIVIIIIIAIFDVVINIIVIIFISSSS